MTASPARSEPEPVPGTNRGPNPVAVLADRLPSPDYSDPYPNRQVASPLYRVAARVADWIIVGGIAAALNLLWAPGVLDIDEVTAASLSPFAHPLLMVAFAITYTVWEFIWLLTEGATPGKQLFGLYVLDPKSRRGLVEATTAFKRLALRVLFVLPYGWLLVLAGSALSMALMADDRAGRRTMMDRVATTTVRRLPRGTQRFAQWFWIWVTIQIVCAIVYWILYL